MIDPTARQSILEAWERVLDSGRYVLGPELLEFEREFADYLGVRHCIGVSSGTDALTLALRAAGVLNGEVLVPALSFIATAEAVVHAGAIPVFTDVDPETWVMTAETAEEQITERTVAIVPVHLFGNPAPVDELLHIAPLVEDACQAVGTEYKGRMAGSLGRAAAFSFYPSKNLPGVGDGGAVTTDDYEIASRVRLLRHHGSADGETHHLIGGTYRLDELQAAALRIGLFDLPGRVAEQRRFAQQWQEDLDGVQRETPGGKSSWHRTVALTDQIEGRSYYTTPLHHQPSMRRYWRGPLPNAERFARENVCLSPESMPPPSSESPPSTGTGKQATRSTTRSSTPVRG